jgi:HEAT repeat protein
MNIIEILNRFSDDDAGVRAAVVSVLGANIDQFPKLIKGKLLDTVQDVSQPVEIRQDALFSLSKIDAPEIKSLLIDNLGSDDWQMRQSAALGLGNFEGDEISGLLEPLTRDSSWQVREASAVTLGNFDQPKIIGYLKPLLDDDNWEVRLAAVDALGNSDDPKIVDLLTPGLNDSAWQIRESVTESLGQFNDSKVAESLTPLLKDDNVFVRQAAVQSIGKWSNPGAIEVLIPGLSDPSLSVREAARFALINKVVDFPSFVAEYPQLRELSALVEEYKSKPGAIVLIYEGLDGDAIPNNNRRQPGWSQGLLLSEELNLMNKLSSGKIELREGNSSGNFIYDTQKDVEKMGEELRMARLDANSSNRQLIVIGNSYANRLIPLAFEWAQNKYSDPTIKADLYIGTGDPGWWVNATTEHLRKASVKEPIIMGSLSDGWFRYPYMFGRDVNANYLIFYDVNHAGPMGYFDHPDSVATIIDSMGYTLPPLSRINYYYEQINNLEVSLKIDNMLPATSFLGVDSIKVPFVTVPKIDIQPIQQYSPIFNSMSDGLRRYQYVPIAPQDYYLQHPARVEIPRAPLNLTPYYIQQFRAPDNYYRSPAATIPSYTPPLQPSIPQSNSSGFSNWP